MTIFLVPNPLKPVALEMARKVIQLFAKQEVRLLVDEQFPLDVTKYNCVQRIPPEQAYNLCDIVLTIGGDGTMLHAARHAITFQKPLLGINIGKLGFLAIVESNELEKLGRLLAGEYTVERRSILSAECGEDAPCTELALNDIVLFKVAPEKAIELDIYCDDILVSSFRGDGVIFATPTGSTAYSLSAGGPILDARVPAMVVTQICAHVVQTPPMVFAADRVLKVISRGSEMERVVMSFDGLANIPVPAGKPVWIRQSDITVPLVQFSDADQLKSIDKKLKGR